MSVQPPPLAQPPRHSIPTEHAPTPVHAALHAHASVHFTPAPQAPSPEQVALQRLPALQVTVLQAPAPVQLTVHSSAPHVTPPVHALSAQSTWQLFPAQKMELEQVPSVHVMRQVDAKAQSIDSAHPSALHWTSHGTPLGQAMVGQLPEALHTNRHAPATQLAPVMPTQTSSQRTAASAPPALLLLLLELPPPELLEEPGSPLRASGTATHVPPAPPVGCVRSQR